MSTSEGSNTEELPVAACWQLIREAVVGRLAVTTRGAPDIFPVNHVVDHGSVVFRTGAGTKLAAADGHDVAFEVDGYDASEGIAWSVVVKGAARQISEKNESAYADSLGLAPWQDGPKPRFLRIEASSVTGRRLAVPSTPTRARA